MGEVARLSINLHCPLFSFEFLHIENDYQHVTLVSHLCLLLSSVLYSEEVARFNNNIPHILTCIPTSVRVTSVTAVTST